MTALATNMEILSERTLEELADAANREHAFSLQAGTAMLHHAIRAGEALMAAREQCGEGNWRRWLADNFEATPFTASTYIRIAHQREAIQEAGETSVGAALTLLRERGLPGPFQSGGGHGRGYDDETKAEARRLYYDEGKGTREIAQLVGAGRQSVRRWVDDEYAERAQKATLKARAERREAERQERENAEKRKAARLARKAGGGIGKAYSLAESIQDALGQAEREATDARAKAALVRAGEHYRKMRDEIVSALGVS